MKETSTVTDHILDLQEYHVELFLGQTSTITIEDQKWPISGVEYGGIL